MHISLILKLIHEWMLSILLWKLLLTHRIVNSWGVIIISIRVVHSKAIHCIAEFLYTRRPGKSLIKIWGIGVRRGIAAVRRILRGLIVCKHCICRRISCTVICVCSHWCCTYYLLLENHPTSTTVLWGRRCPTDLLFPASSPRSDNLYS